MQSVKLHKTVVRLPRIKSTTKSLSDMIVRSAIVSSVAGGGVARINRGSGSLKLSRLFLAQNSTESSTILVFH